MNKQILNYETPEVESVEINVEKGFASTDGSATGGEGTNQDSNAGDGEF